MQSPRREVEGPGVQQQEAALAGRDGRQLGEANVVANGDGDLTVGRDVDQSDLVAGGEDVRFAEGDLAGDVDVEEVDLAVGSE